MGASIPEKQDLMAQEAIFMSFMSSIYGIEVIFSQQSLSVIEAVKIPIIWLIDAKLSCMYLNHILNMYI